MSSSMESAMLRTSRSTWRRHNLEDGLRAYMNLSTDDLTWHDRRYAKRMTCR